MADEKKSGPNEEELEELEDEIEHARRDSDEATHGSFYEGEHPMFEDSGEESRKDESDTGVESNSDDQNIAPG
jgi:archaellum component FlaC